MKSMSAPISVFLSTGVGNYFLCILPMFVITNIDAWCSCMCGYICTYVCVYCTHTLNYPICAVCILVFLLNKRPWRLFQFRIINIYFILKCPIKKSIFHLFMYLYENRTHLLSSFMPDLDIHF